MTERHAPAAPDVTVVVICFNDAARLPRAVASVQRQTLRNLEIVIVDDASTDETATIARQIAAADPRVRYERLPQNSGGCSAPRNRGLELARAPWVMFCDSDDEYERHACKNLLLAAERTGAEVVCGTAVRIDVRTGRTRRWRPELHDIERVVDALADLPELLYDTISVDKIYRVDLLRRAGIRFPEGILFEDQLFTLQAMASATRLAVIPQTVYYWYVDKLGDDLSITQRRVEARNVDSRIAVNRLIDDYLDERGLADLRAVKDEKFLRHDLYLYLSSMVEADDETAEVLVDRLVPYVEQVPLDATWRLRPALRVAIYHLLLRDVAGVRAAMRFLVWASAVDATITSDGGRELWACEHLATGTAVAGRPAHEWLDVTGLGLLRVPFSQRRLLHRIDELVVSESDRLVARGRTRDYDGSLTATDRIELRLTLPGDRVALRAPARWVDGPEGRAGWYRWEVDAVPAAAVPEPIGTSDRGTVALAVERNGVTCVMAARSDRASCPRVVLPFPGPTTRLGADAVEIGPGDNGAVSWRPTTVSTARLRRRRRQERRTRVPGVSRLVTVLDLVRRDWLRSALVRLGRALPRKPIVVLDACSPRAYAGDLGAIDAALAAARPEVERTWAYRSAPELVPAGAGAVERGSLRHSWLLARARWVVDDGAGLPGPARTAVVASSTDGVPVRRVGLDDPAVLARRAAAAAVRRAGRRSRLLLVASPAAGEVLAPALGHRRAVAAVGLPRLDQAIASRARSVAAARGALDLPIDRAVVVYAPAARDTDVRADLSLDVEAWAARLGDRVYLVVAPAPGEPFAVPTRLRWAVRELTSAEGPAAFLGAADLVIADYSPVVGDAALLDVPVVLYWPDRAVFVDRAHGMYPGVTEAGPVVEDADGLVAQVETWLADPAAWDRTHGSSRRAWAAHWAGPADGASAARAVAAILGGAP